MIDPAGVKRILFITLSNVGDIILTTPALSAVRRRFPSARIDVMVGPAGKGVFDRDPAVFKTIIYDKHSTVGEKRRLQLKLKKLKYDVVVDLRNTVFGLLIGPRYRTSTIQTFPPGVVHAKDRHLYRLRSVGIDDPGSRSYIHITAEDENYIAGLLAGKKISGGIVCVNPGAKSHLKRWTPDGFAASCDRLISECGVNVIFTGLAGDRETVKDVTMRMRRRAENFVDLTDIGQLAALLKRSSLLITNDSAPMHLACAVGAKVLAIFGPTDPRRYGPTGEFDTVVSRKLKCVPCESAVCKYNYECMKQITPDEVYEAAKMMIEGYG